MSGNNNIEKENIMKAMKVVVRSKKGSNPSRRNQISNQHSFYNM